MNFFFFPLCRYEELALEVCPSILNTPCIFGDMRIRGISAFYLLLQNYFLLLQVQSNLYNYYYKQFCSFQSY